MNIFKKKKILITHSGTFHADDIFATATLSILLNGNIKVIRTRDESMFSKGDFVYDIGGEYDPNRNRFDHHQEGGAGTRLNGVPYAAFGLVWKTYGAKICGSQEAANMIEEKLVQPIDADDNGIDIFKLNSEVSLYLMQTMFYAFRPTWKEEQDYDTPFFECVEFAKKILHREIIRTHDALEAKSIVVSAYGEAKDKRAIFLSSNYPWKDTISMYPEPLYIAFPKDGKWRAECVMKQKYSYENRKPLPASWAGKRDEELEKVTGVKGAIFCHNGRFLVVAKTKEAIEELVAKALAD
jgi:uncharacterized UPF0160 family protein